MRDSEYGTQNFWLMSRVELWKNRIGKKKNNEQMRVKVEQLQEGKQMKIVWKLGRHRFKLILYSLSSLSDLGPVNIFYLTG